MESKFIRYVDYNMSNLCQICANKGEKYFCNLYNLDCKSLDQFRKQSGIERPGFKCEFLNCKPQNIKYCSMVFPVFLSEKGFSNVQCEIFPHLQGLITKNICNEPSLHILRNNKNNFQFLIIGKYQTCLEMMDFVTCISEICRDENISELLVVYLEKLYMSKSTFEECYNKATQNIYMVSMEEIIEEYNPLLKINISRIKAANSELLFENVEKSDEVGDLLNIYISIVKIN